MTDETQPLSELELVDDYRALLVTRDSKVKERSSLAVQANDLANRLQALDGEIEKSYLTGDEMLAKIYKETAKPTEAATSTLAAVKATINATAVEAQPAARPTAESVTAQFRLGSK
jgi:hypothetical protein